MRMIVNCTGKRKGKENRSNRNRLWEVKGVGVHTYLEHTCSARSQPRAQRCRRRRHRLTAAAAAVAAAVFNQRALKECVSISRNGLR